MSMKRKSMASSGETAKKSRKVIDTKMKLKILQDYEDGRTVKEIANEMKLANSTVFSIIKRKGRVKKGTIRRSFKARLIHEMEKLLAIWFDNQIQNNKPISLLIIQTKARSIFETLKAREGGKSTESFGASHGWFHRFCRRFNLQNWKSSREVATADIEAKEEFVDELDSLIKGGSYCAEQIFNVDETVLWWKKMPERAYMQDEAEDAMPVFKDFKDKITLLLGGNAAGFKLKPLLIDCSKNPHALKNISENSLPVYYRANVKACMTPSLFEDWFLRCFIPSAQHYCAEKGVPFKILLLLDSFLCHPMHLDDLHPDVTVAYLPKNISAVLQPMEQGVITMFKAFYYCKTFSQAVTATENDGLTLCDFWESYSVLDCIKNIKSAWDEMTDKCMQGVWQKCIKSFSINSEPFDNLEQTDVIQAIQGLANVFDLDVELEDIVELVNNDEEELTNEELIELEAGQYVNEEEEERIEEVETKVELVNNDEGELTNEELIEFEARQNVKDEEEEERIKEAQKKFTVHGLAGVFSKINTAMMELEAMDPNTERFNKVKHGVSEILECYSEIYEKKRLQRLVHPSFEGENSVSSS